MFEKVSRSLKYDSNIFSSTNNQRRVEIQSTSEMTPFFTMIKCNWASEVSPTLGCSIEISRDIYVSVGRYVCCGPKFVGGITCP